MLLQSVVTMITTEWCRAHFPEQSALLPGDWHHSREMEQEMWQISAEQVYSNKMKWCDSLCTADLSYKIVGFSAKTPGKLHKDTTRLETKSAIFPSSLTPFSQPFYC